MFLMPEPSMPMRLGDGAEGLLQRGPSISNGHVRHATVDAGTPAGAGSRSQAQQVKQLQLQNHTNAHGPTSHTTIRLGPVSGTTLLSATIPIVDNARPSPVLSQGKWRKSYLNRPLPPTPQYPPLPNRSPMFIPGDMPARPSTSDGPATNQQWTGNMAGKRMSRDDMALPKRVAPPIAPHRAGTHPYWPGTPQESTSNWAATSTPMLASSEPFRRPFRTPTSTSMASAEIPIGIAYGSHTSSSSATRTMWSEPATTFAASPLSTQTTAVDVSRTKSQKRRLFGGLFRGRKDPEAHDSSPRFRGHTMSEEKHNPKHKPIVLRSNTAPLTFSHRVEESDSPSFLDVQIPDVRLERYSVMFSGVLNPRGGQKESSLLQRRQATLEKLQSINDSIEWEMEREKDAIRQRWVTSPQATRSPASFNLFPHMANRNTRRPSPHPIHTPRSPRLRSNTSPALLPSPSEATFGPASAARVVKKEKKMVKVVSPRTIDEQDRAAMLDRLRKQRAEPIRPAQGFRFEHNVSSLVLESPRSSLELEQGQDVVHISGLTARPAVPDDQWPIMTHAMSSTSSIATKHTATSSTNSSVQTQATQVSVTDRDDAALQAAVENSIARQISVSREQRELLLRGQTSNLQFGTRSAATAMARAAAKSSNVTTPSGRSTPLRQLGHNERVSETKIATPVLVVPSLAVPSDARAAHRKSERIVLEGWE